MFVFVVVALLLVAAAGWLLGLWLLVLWLIRRPILSLPIAVYVGLAMWVGAHDAQALVIYALVLLGMWRLTHRPSFERTVGWHLRTSWRRLWVYDRRWRRTMVLSGLGKRYGMRQRVPRIRSVHSTPGVDRVLISLVRGQSTDDFERAASRLAHSFGARCCVVSDDRPGRLLLVFAAGDPPAESPRAPDRSCPPAFS
jgi:DNA segregation ATPase FtsK/SpoIIIE, S-DNA-T family